MGRNFRALTVCVLCFSAQRALPASAPSMSEVLAASSPSDWRLLDADNTLYVELPRGRIIIELAPHFAPRHLENVKQLVRARYFDGLSVLRVQDDYVAQWGDPKHRHPLPAGIGKVAPEFDAPIWPRMPFTALPDGDVYAPEVGFSEGFAVARSTAEQKTWLAHCYGMVGVGRDLDEYSGSGAELYVVIGHAPRHLDRNVALIGRVVQGMPLLSSLPRGSAEMGFYAKGEHPVGIKSIRVAGDLPAAKQVRLEALRTDSPAFAALIESRRNRPEEFFKRQAGRIDLCNVPLPIREAPAGKVAP